MAATVVSVVTSTVILAGSIPYAIAGGGSMYMAYGVGAAAIGAARAYSRLRSKYTEKKTPKRSIINKIGMNPILKLVTSAVIFFAGLGLALSTALSGVGGTLPLAFGYLMMVSGAAGAVTGAVATVVGGIKLAAKGFSHKNNKAAPTKEQAPPAKPKTGLIADQSAKPAFDAAAKNALSAPKTVPSTKPANAPKGPKAASG